MRNTVPIYINASTLIYPKCCCKYSTIDMVGETCAGNNYIHFKLLHASESKVTFVMDTRNAARMKVAGISWVR